MIGISRLEVKQLRVLDALLKERNLSRVAEQMGLTQQAISVQLKNLRDVFDDRLFVRQSNGVLPTPKAEQLAPAVHDLLCRLEALTQPLTFDPAMTNSTFTISAMDYSQKVLLMPLIRRLRKIAPFLKLNIRELAIDQLAPFMANGDIDLAITIPSFCPPNLPTEELFQETYVCVADKASPLATHKLSIAELADLPQIVVSAGRDNMRGSADLWFERHGLKRNTLLAVPDYSSVPQALMGTDLIAFMPSRLLPHPDLVKLDVQTTPPGFTQVLCWHNRSAKDPLHLWLRQQLRLSIDSSTQ